VGKGTNELLTPKKKKEDATKGQGEGREVEETSGEVGRAKAWQTKASPKGADKGKKN